MNNLVDPDGVSFTTPPPISNRTVSREIFPIRLILACDQTLSNHTIVRKRIDQQLIVFRPGLMQ
ncbi:MAG: hypothetical protein ACFE9C_16670 [Candidatus Hodarchaeota archaeon]